MPQNIPTFDQFKSQASPPGGAIPSFDEFKSTPSDPNEPPAPKLAKAPIPFALKSNPTDEDLIKPVGRGGMGSFPAINPGYTEGVERMAEPGIDAKAAGLHKILTTAGEGVAPLAIPMTLMAGPMAALGAAGGAALGGVGGKMLADSMGAGPGVSDLVGDAGATIAGGAGAHLATKAFPGINNNPAGAIRHAIKILPKGQTALDAWDFARGKGMPEVPSITNPAPPPTGRTPESESWYPQTPPAAPVKPKGLIDRGSIITAPPADTSGPVKGAGPRMGMGMSPNIEGLTPEILPPQPTQSQVRPSGLESKDPVPSAPSGGALAKSAKVISEPEAANRAAKVNALFPKVQEALKNAGMTASDLERPEVRIAMRKSLGISEATLDAMQAKLTPAGSNVPIRNTPIPSESEDLSDLLQKSIDDLAARKKK